MKKTLHARVGIVGAGPAGLLLSQLLHLNGIDSAIIETRTRERIEKRIRAGQMEPNTARIFTEAGVGARMQAEGLVHHGVIFHYEGMTRRLDLQGLTGRSIMMYGQREIVKDLMDARLAAGGTIFFGVSEVAVHDLESKNPSLAFSHEGEEHLLTCDFIAGCDGYHGVCRPAMARISSVFELKHPFCWLGILAEAPPFAEEVTYACHERGLALFSMRSRALSRNYVQCGPQDDLAQWPDHRIWDELGQRLSGHVKTLQPGPIIEKSIVPLRSFVVAPMQYGRLFLAGDAAHIVPPSAAKGLNLAVADVCLLARAFERYYRGNDELLRNYSSRALANVWEGQRFSYFMTKLLHCNENHSRMERRLQVAELDNIFQTGHAGKSFAESYVGPEDIWSFKPG
jgi:p-hydroxybenzoate 3-monooxygenase